MKILVKDNRIFEIAENITFGVYDESYEKWRIADAEDNALYYVVDDGFSLVEDAEVPSDYVDGKYFFENGEFVLNEEWKPYVSPEERIAQLEEQVAMQEEAIALADETTIELFEAQLAQEEILIAQDEAIIELFELYENL